MGVWRFGELKNGEVGVRKEVRHLFLLHYYLRSIEEHCICLPTVELESDYLLLLQ